MERRGLGPGNLPLGNEHGQGRAESPGLYSASPRLPKERREMRHEEEKQVDERKVQDSEEKIAYDPTRLGGEMESEELEGPAAMSATSYPGQEVSFLLLLLG